jgi:hypothetical protein
MCLTEVKSWDLLKGHMSLVELWWCDGTNESSICNTALNSILSMRDFPQWRLLRNIHPWIPRAYLVSHLAEWLWSWASTAEHHRRQLTIQWAKMHDPNVTQ